LNIAHVIGPRPEESVEEPDEQPADTVREGDPRAVAAVETFTDDLATGAAALLLAVDPALVVVGGGLSRAGDLIIGGLRERLTRLCLHAPEIVTGALGDEAVTTGAVRIALERDTEPLFPAGLPL
jgi:predicted NBD/HSP70 family sugar kinase